MLRWIFDSHFFEGIIQLPQTALKPQAETNMNHGFQQQDQELQEVPHNSRWTCEAGPACWFT